MKTKLLKLALSAMALLPMGAWAETATSTATTWLFNQFYHNATVATITTTSETKGSVYDYDNLYLCIGDGNEKRTRTITAQSATMPNSTAPSVDNVTPFAKGTYVGLYYNAGCASWGNTVADANTRYQMASFKAGSDGTLYVLALPTYNAENRSVEIYTYENKTMTKKAFATRTEKSGSPWFLLSCSVNNGQRYFIGSQQGGWTLYGVKFVPSSDKANRKKITINMSKGWATFSSCSNFSVPAGYTAYKAKVNGTSATLTALSDIPANTGVILKGTAEESLELSSATSASSDVSDNDLIANVGAYTLPESNGTYYDYTLAYENAAPIFKHSSGSGSLAANKAYLRTTVNVTGAEGARGFNLVFDEDETTAVADVRTKKEDVSGDYYDLSGRKVVQPTRGLYIVNGKKVFIK